MCLLATLRQDLYYQEDAGNSSAELVFDEFEEVLSRIFDLAVWARMQQAEAATRILDQDGDGDLDVDDVDDLFDLCDTDGSESITPEELAVVLEKRLNGGAARLVAEQLVALADADGSGAMSRDELRSAVKKMSESAAQGKEKAEGFERGIESWLTATFFPRALAAIKKKKLGK